MTCPCDTCVERQTNPRPKFSFYERAPRVGDFIFLDTSLLFKRHESFYLILKCECVTGLAKNGLDSNYGFDYRTTAIMFDKGKGLHRKTPLLVKAREKYWVYGEL